MPSLTGSAAVPLIISIVILGIMTFSIFITIKYRNPEQYKNTRLNVFFSSLASVAIIFVGFNIILTSVSFEYNQRLARFTKTKEAVDKLWLYPNQILQASRKARPEFRASFFMNNVELYNLVLLPGKQSPLTTEAAIEEQFIATVMIQTWEDCLLARNYDETPLSFWMRSFLTWAQNPYFRNYYQRVKFEYQDFTNQFADLLFEYAEKIPVPTKDIQIYRTTVEQIKRDPRYQSLLNGLS